MKLHSLMATGLAVMLSCAPNKQPVVEPQVDRKAYFLRTMKEDKNRVHVYEDSLRINVNDQERVVVECSREEGIEDLRAIANHAQEFSHKIIFGKKKGVLIESYLFLDNSHWYEWGENGRVGKPLLFKRVMETAAKATSDISYFIHTGDPVEYLPNADHVQDLLFHTAIARYVNPFARVDATLVGQRGIAHYEIKTQSQAFKEVLEDIENDAQLGRYSRGYSADLLKKNGLIYTDLMNKEKCVSRLCNFLETDAVIVTFTPWEVYDKRNDTQ